MCKNQQKLVCLSFTAIKAEKEDVFFAKIHETID